ncbi:MAG: lysine--tRNA ligase [Acidobacteria bacterium]|nr:MAG: lysine--tRNA ligase [Acidobacteriota bacterium]
MTVPFIEQNDQTEARRDHLEALRGLVGNVYPNKFERSNVSDTPAGEDTITSIVAAFKKFAPRVAEGEKPSADELDLANSELNKIRVRLAGRIAAPPRVMGKAAFVHLSDGGSRLQIYVRRQDVVGVRNDAGGGEVNGWELFSLLDHGDFIGVEGFLFVTKTGELSVHVEKLQFLAKALLPMPDKMHGINDPEIRQRQRYADLIAGSLKLEPGVGSQEPERKELNSRQAFELRARVIKEIRRFLDEQGYIEVETPMLTPLATGAAARPFKTHHNALDIDLFARIAPELYLKRLTVGGFEKVYELNRNFRNEGISTKHNPEFTMLEFYWAYADVNDMMDLHEEMMRSVVEVATGGVTIRYGEHEIDFSQPFQRITMKEAIARYRGSEVNPNEEPVRIIELFEQFAEPHLIQPTFITDFPKAISPLSKASPSDPSVAERFEYFVGGLESANGFSELNDPEEQYQRFKDQMVQRERGDEEAMVMDEDYIRALSYGMPPAAGIGVGIDRLVMLLANKHSIRDVILFPHMRPERSEGSRQEAEGSVRTGSGSDRINDAG